MFSEKTNWPLTTNELTKACQERKREHLPILDLTESNPTRCGFEYDSEKLLAALRDSRTVIYEPDPHGLLSARLAVVDYYAERGIRLHPDQIFLTASTSEAYSFVFHLLADAGDSILAPRPSYPLFDFLARFHELELLDYPLGYGPPWQIDQAAFASRISARTRAALVVHPNNPTGSFVHEDEAAFLLERCAEHSMTLIADEVFSDYGLPGAAISRAPGFAGEDRVLVFTLSGLSKISALPQMKCAWIVASGPPDLLRKAVSRLEVIADTYLSISAPVAWALPQLLDLRHTLQPQIVQRLQSNLARLDARIAGNSVSRLEIEGGWYTILRVPSTRTDEDWAVDLLKSEGVWVHPGHFYDFPGEGHLVVSLLPRPDVFEDGIGKLVGLVDGEL
ncbi:MAG TPA: pyridoxal phosphate-dependent aminotransferase [Terriglobia bacterium]|nr:pyridoxal phosphate-dependent aminotransferase [Terriglobia bacterium]